MAAGEIVEEGSHEDLLKLGGIYKKIYDIQTGTDTDGEGGEE
jgi:ABC-type multidrug transport system fused ATPase/permease subunit